MAQRDANKVQLDFPQLTADLIAALRLTGTLGVLDLSDVVIPTISVGNVRPQTISVVPVAYDSAEIFSGHLSTPALNAIVFDTGALAAGTYDCFFGFAFNRMSSGPTLEFQWRNAANAANLATWFVPVFDGVGGYNSGPVGPFSLNIGLNERIRAQNTVIASAGELAAFGMVHRQPTP